MERAITLTHKKLKRDFIISSKTKPQTLKNLIKKALRLQTEIRHFKADGNKLSLEELITQSKGNQFEIVLDDQSSEEKSKSDVVSQKNMSKLSGRKNPPSEHELLDSKFYIDDFQLFMSEVSAKKTTKLFGIVFFNSRKKASFLGKKILRELIFEFDKIQFFYALHPIKMHTSSALLGEVLVFALFRGKIMIHEREFPEQITAADEIPNYVKNLVKIGQLNFDRPLQHQQKKSKNLIHVHEQRSFDHKIEDSPEKLSDFGNRPNRTTEIIKIKPITPDKQVKARNIFANPKPDSAVKSPITNQISFENDTYQPEWFFEGDALTRLEKGLLSALIKTGDNNILTFINGLSLKDRSKEKLNIKLLKVFLKEYSDDKMSTLTPQQKQYIETNQQNRKSFVFNALLKLYKFGDISDFLDILSKGVATLQEQAEAKPKDEPKPVLYSTVVKQVEKPKSGFTIKLKNCQSEFDSPTSPYKQHPSPFREDQQMHRYHTQIAKDFYDRPLPDVNKSLLKDIVFSRQFDEAERAQICDLLLKHDAFLMQSFVSRRDRNKKMEKIPPKIVKRYLREVQSRYQNIRARTGGDPQARIKLQKLQIFNGLVYFLYKQRVINKKQLKISFYLYTWSDLNILSAFELYLHDRHLQEFVDTLYAIDYNYYLHGLYEIDHAQVEQFTLSVEEQLIILFLYEHYIVSGEERISLQKFIRAGDTSLLALYTDLKIQKQDLIRRMIELSKSKKEELDNINNSENRTAGEMRQKKQDRCNFIDQVVANRYKTFTKKALVQYCINHDQPLITSLFDLLDHNNEQMEWIDSFNCYITRIDQIHMKVVIQELANEAGIELHKIESCRTDIVKGIYEAYLVTNDRNDTIDSLQRAARKVSRTNSPQADSVK